ncbi:MAG: hypothetical protein LKF99_06455 [Bifidobacterium sp.]|nr:hypothetical protein [Bifidobacterium sp.]
MVIKPKTIVGAIALAFGAVSFALSFFEPLASGICGLIAGMLGLACGLDWGASRGEEPMPAARTSGSAVSDDAQRP